MLFCHPSLLAISERHMPGPRAAAASSAAFAGRGPLPAHHSNPGDGGCPLWGAPRAQQPARTAHRTQPARPAHMPPPPNGRVGVGGRGGRGSGVGTQGGEGGEVGRDPRPPRPRPPARRRALPSTLGTGLQRLEPRRPSLPLPRTKLGSGVPAQFSSFRQPGRGLAPGRHAALEELDNRVLAHSGPQGITELCRIQAAPCRARS